MSLWLRQALKVPLAAWGGLAQSLRPTPPGVVFLIYHSVAGRLPLELDLPCDVFEWQLERLADQGAVIAYDEAVDCLSTGRMPPSRRFVLTFDDGYLDFYTHVYPLLERLRLPAILFVTTGFVDDRVAYPLMARPDLPAAPVTWPMLAEMAASPWVTLGSHTHTHPLLAGLPPDRLEDELVRPIRRFEEMLGIRPRHFAYPRAVWQEEVVAQVARYYDTAVIGGVGDSAGWDRYRIARLPIRRSDGRRFFEPKLRGLLAAEEHLYRVMHDLAGR